MKIRLRRKKKRAAPAPLVTEIFDAEYYRATYDDIQLHPDPWGHYCDYGFREDRDPNPLFSTRYYRKNYLAGQDEVNPLLHYLKDADPLANTHPLFDGAFYASQLSQLPDEISLLEHFLRHNIVNRLSPSPFFDSAAYLDTYPDIQTCKMNPLYHYVRYGLTEARHSFIDLNHIDLIRFRDPNEVESLRELLDPELDFIVHLLQVDRAKPTIICVTHEASLTGAPLIIFKIAETLRRDYDVNIVNLLCNDGEIVSQFEMLGPTFSLQGTAPYRHGEHFSSAMNCFVRSVGMLNVVGALVNSAESRHVIKPLSELNVPIHALIHENARCYGKFESKPFYDVGKYCQRVIFPSTYVYQAGIDGTGVNEQQSMVLPQGLLREEMLEPAQPEAAKKIRAEHGIPDDAVLVLGCGTGDSRKGLDLFIATAISVIKRDATRRIYFGWVGNLEVKNNVSNSFWAEMDVATAGIADRVVFFGQQREVKDFFDAADIFYLSSRVDPFPCVVNEAMARGKPIALFDQGSGCVDLVSDEGGVIIPFSDICSACEEIINLAGDSQKRAVAGRRNREYVAEHMKFDHYVASLMHALVDDMQQPECDLLDNEPLQPHFQRVRMKSNDQAKRVFFLAPCWSVSGVNTFAENLGRELNHRGFDARVLFTSSDSKTLPLDLLPDIPHQFLLSNWVDNTKKNQRLVDFLKSMAPAIVVPNCDYSSSAIAHDLPANVRMVGVLHSDDSEHYLHGYRMGHYWDRIVAVSEVIRSRLLELNPAFADKTEVIRCGIAPPPRLANRVNRQDSLDKLRIIYTGRLEQHQKRIFDFVRLMEVLDRRGISFTMTFIGSGADEKEFQQRAEPFIKRGAARLLGRLGIDQIYQELAGHHAFCLLSDFEGLPISLLEALASGCVPVVTQVDSGINEILTHGQNALTSPLRDIKAMADNLQRLAMEVPLRQRLSAAAAETLEQHQLTTPRMADQYAALFESIFADISRGRQPRDLPLHCQRVGSLLEAA